MHSFPTQHQKLKLEHTSCGHLIHKSSPLFFLQFFFAIFIPVDYISEGLLLRLQHYTFVSYKLLYGQLFPRRSTCASHFEKYRPNFSLVFSLFFTLCLSLFFSLKQTFIFNPQKLGKHLIYYHWICFSSAPSYQVSAPKVILSKIIHSSSSFLSS